MLSVSGALFENTCVNSLCLIVSRLKLAYLAVPLKAACRANVSVGCWGNRENLCSVGSGDQSVEGTSDS